MNKTPFRVTARYYWPAWLAFVIAMFSGVRWFFCYLGNDLDVAPLVGCIGGLVVYVLLLMRGDCRMDDWRRLTRG